MKIIGKTFDDLSQYPLDIWSILHFIAGNLSFVIINYITNLMFPILASLYITYTSILLGSVIWELIENIALPPIKLPSKKKDDVLNSQFDTMCVFIGGIVGFFYRNNLMMILFIISVSTVLLAILWIIMKFNSSRLK